MELGLLQVRSSSPRHWCCMGHISCCDLAHKSSSCPLTPNSMGLCCAGQCVSAATWWKYSWTESVSPITSERFDLAKCWMGWCCHHTCSEEQCEGWGDNRCTTLNATLHCAKLKGMRMSPGTHRGKGMECFCFTWVPSYRDLKNILHLNNLQRYLPYSFSSVIFNWGWVLSPQEHCGSVCRHFRFSQPGDATWHLVWRVQECNSISCNARDSPPHKEWSGLKSH